jgi:hypothetical protein
VAREPCDTGCGHLALWYGDWRIVAVEREPNSDEMEPRTICHQCSVVLLANLAREGLRRRVQIDVRLSPEDIAHMRARLQKLRPDL